MSMAFTECASSELRFGALQEVVGRGKPGAAQQRSIGVSMQQIRRGRRVARSSISQGSAGPMGVRIKAPYGEVSE